ncbi:MAG: transglycosylase domain-containing protein, partial [bacterium]|nr:transglycosylase domain-containing protein [bacterium]
IAGFLYVLRDLPSPTKLQTSETYAVSSQIFDRNGVLLYEIIGDEHRIPIKLADLPKHVTQAVVAIEDKNFYSHWGFDVTGIIRALRANITGGQVQGGSTITQQLVKNALLTREKTVTRKIKEGVLAVITELIYSKDEILEMYLNYISYGGTSVGIEAASQTYFDKPAKDLTLSEATLLAGLPQAPTKYSPFGSTPEKGKERQQAVLRRMAEDDYITKIEEAAAASEPIQFAISRSDIAAPHFVFYVRDLLYEEFGVDTVERGGLRVTTTLDLDLQKTAEASLSAELLTLERYQVSNGAALVVKPNTGEILAMIGSKDYFDSEQDGQVNVTLAERQPGSSIKPLMYATAFQDKTLNPGSILIDAPTCFTSAGQKPYCPKNYDGSYSGPVAVRRSLANSLNITAVKALRTLGVERFMEVATALGITTWNDPSRYGLSLTLGGGEVRMIDMAQAFGTLANEGVKVPLTPVLRIEDYKGNVLRELDREKRLADLEFLSDFDEQTAGDLQRVMDRAPAYLVSHILQDNPARQHAFGLRSELVIPNQIVSVKTGTTNELRDNWTIGYTPEFLVATWVGNNDNTRMNGRVVSGVTGAAPIFNDIMRFVLADREPVWQEKPPDVLSAQVCAHGMPPTAGDNCQAKDQELYWDQSIPSRSLAVRKNTWINPTTGLPPNPGEQIEGLVLEERSIFQDPVTDYYCSDCSRPVNEEGKVLYEQRTVPQEYQIQPYSGKSE